jgi:hypothetical protein
MWYSCASNNKTQKLRLVLKTERKCKYSVGTYVVNLLINIHVHGKDREWGGPHAKNGTQ